MELNHIGVTNKNEEQAIRFYQDFLGLEKTKEMLLPLELSEQLFSISQEIEVLVFEKQGVKIEVFLSDFQHAAPNFIHSCIMLDNFSEIIEKTQQARVELITGRHNEKTVYFIKDFSGNMFEIKQKP